MENYRILKLKNGDSVIAGLGGVTDKNTVILERPMQFKTMTVMDDRSMGVRDYLLVRNWAEYSTDKNVEIPNDSILAILTPDEKLMMVYDLEKTKEDNPSKVEFTETMPLTDTPEETQIENFQKMNIQLQLPPEASEQFLEMLGIQFEEMEDDMGDIEEEDDLDDDIDIEDDVNWDPPKSKSKKPKPTPSLKKDKDVTFGNSPDDWSPDPSDYLK
jgi:hypothetical protein